MTEKSSEKDTTDNTETHVAVQPWQAHFALEGTMPDGLSTMMRCQHHLPDDNKSGTTDMSDFMFNLGDITIWPCRGCVSRIRDSILTDVMVESSKLILRHDPEFVAQLKARMAHDAELAVENNSRLEERTE